MEDSPVEWRNSTEPISELKNNLVSVFNDNFVTQLLFTHSEYTTVDRSFIESLIRRIKRLLQFIVVK